MAASRRSLARGRIGGVLAIAAVSLAVAAPAPSSAATVGLPLPAPQTNVGFLCGFDNSTCTYAQELLAGKPMSAPFTGTIKSFQVQGVDGTIRLVVLRKRDDGQFKAIRDGRKWAAGLADTQVAKFPASLAIRKGDFIGLSLFDIPGAGGTEIRGSSTDTQSYCKVDFFPALEIGSFAPSDRDCGQVALYNANIVR